MRVGEGRVINMNCLMCLKAFHYYPHPYCYEDNCINANPIVYKPTGFGEKIKKDRDKKGE